MGKCWLPCQVVFSLSRLQSNMCNIMLFLLRTILTILGWDELAKDTLHGPHQGEAKNQNNLIIVGTILPGIKKFSSWQPLWLFLWISQVSGLAIKQNASQHNNGVVCYSQSIKHKNPEEREKNVLSSLPEQPVFSQRNMPGCVCKKNVLTLQLICFREVALKGGHSHFFTRECSLFFCHLLYLGQKSANQGQVQPTACFCVVHKLKIFLHF